MKMISSEYIYHHEFTNVMNVINIYIILPQTIVLPLFPPPCQSLPWNVNFACKNILRFKRERENL